MKLVHTCTPGTLGLEGDAEGPQITCQHGRETHPEGSRERVLLWGVRLDLGWQLGLGLFLTPLAASDSQKHPQKILGELRLELCLEDGSVPSLCGDNHCPLLSKSLF